MTPRSSRPPRYLPATAEIAASSDPFAYAYACFIEQHDIPTGRAVSAAVAELIDQAWTEPVAPQADTADIQRRVFAECRRRKQRELMRLARALVIAERRGERKAA